MRILTFILALAIASGVGRAATVNWNAFQDTGVILPGTPSSAPALGLTNWVQIGYFKTLTDSQVTSLAATQSGTLTLAGDFFTFGKLQISTFSGSNPQNSEQGAANAGGWQQSTVFLYSSNPTFSAGHKAYIWMMSATDNSSLSNAQASVTSQAIFALSTWLFPANDLNSVNIELKDLSTASVPDLTAASLFGTYIASTGNTNLSTAGVLSPQNAVQLQTVPEPSTITFGALAVLMAAGSRRRQRE